MKGITGSAFQKDRPRTKNVWVRFMMSILVILLLFIFGIFLGINLRSSELIHRQILRRAQSYFEMIVLARRWNAGYGGVYVEKRPGVESNPYLFDPDIETEDGRSFTKKNPALMTREISEYAGSLGLFTFHITSLSPLNPANTPSPEEQSALLSFETGEKEFYEFRKIEDRFFFMYMAPLVTEAGCLECHAVQGYKEGDIRGGISVSFDITEINTRLRKERFTILVLGIFSTLTLAGSILVLIFSLMKKIHLAQEAIKKLSVTDPLTGIFNRRYLGSFLNTEFERVKRYSGSFSCIMIDIDYFKRINDTYGHLAGDEVLKQVAGTINENCRKTDVFGRFGGEEFLVILPETGRDAAAAAAEKFRFTVEKRLLGIPGGRTLHCTISLGVAFILAESAKEGMTAETVVHNADFAMYKAKENGRNRVEMFT